MADSDYDRWKAEQGNEVTNKPDYLQSIDRSLITIKRIAVWFLILSILGFLLGLLAAVGAFR
jgi:hypothetical protein